MTRKPAFALPSAHFDKHEKKLEDNDAKDRKRRCYLSIFYRSYVGRQH